ncbi:MAG: hypothetical protein EOO06_00285 [Chitinophagaceae bacterium]|nr:MAG: hypothetical protein EOO06_00285 [Chitinophagaceae bacterium]
MFKDVQVLGGIDSLREHLSQFDDSTTYYKVSVDYCRLWRGAEKGYGDCYYVQIDLSTKYFGSVINYNVDRTIRFPINKSESFDNEFTMFFKDNGYDMEALGKGVIQKKK